MLGALWVRPRKPAPDMGRRLLDASYHHLLVASWLPGTGAATRFVTPGAVATTGYWWPLTALRVVMLCSAIEQMYVQKTPCQLYPQLSYQRMVVDRVALSG